MEKKMKSGIIVALVEIIVVFQVSLASECFSRRFNESLSVVCVCNLTHCDRFESLERTEPGVVTKLTSDHQGKRFAKTQLHFVKNGAFSMTTNDGIQSIIIKPEERFQNILGFGGAFTDATGINLDKLDPKLAESVLADYFSDHGLQYSMGRVPIGGTDFSTHPYTYDDNGGREDLKLAGFKLQTEDFKYKIPRVKQAMAMAKHSLKLFASPWSPPAWMKTNHNLTGKGHIKGDPTGPYYTAYANYLIRFLKEYRKQGIEFWGLTVQNEPFDGELDGFVFNCNGMQPEDQRDFIIKTLGPKLHQEGWDKDHLKVMIMDDDRPFLPKWSAGVLNHTNASQYISGVGFHWYLSSFTSPNVLNDFHDQYPDYFLLSTEACEGADPFEPERVSLGDWGRAENYAYDIITNLNRHTGGWIDWNMALDRQGGPNWVNNLVDSPVIISDDGHEYYKQPTYYALAHFTRFLPPGSVRIGLINPDDEKTDYLQVMVFETPKNETVLFALNRYKSSVPLKVSDPRLPGSTLSDMVGEHSLQTYVWYH